MREAKVRGFSDLQLAKLTGATEDAIRARRMELGIMPGLNQIDTLAAEYPAQTNYLYLTYSGISDDVETPVEHSVLLLGSGAYRIGCSVEFDWCCVNAGNALKRMGYKTIMLNYNPETVSTDYDEFHQLVFDEITYESVLDIYHKFKPIGVVVSMGGQIPNNLALRLHKAGVRILGTSPESIDSAENRHTFSSLLDELGIDQPMWNELSDLAGARAFANDVGYPVLVRPSYVLSGAAMAVVSNERELERYLNEAARVSREHPTVVSKFLENAKEIEFDAVARNGEIVVYAISEHVENAGVHSGDATLVFPAQRMYQETVRKVRKISRKIAKRLNINGPFNIQYIAKENSVKVIECNLRASRSFPFVSKVLKKNFIDLATRVIMGEEVAKPASSTFEIDHVGVKAAQFSFARLDGADPTLGVEMASTGEVGCLGDDFEEALLKSMLSVGYRLPIRTVLLSLGPVESKAEMLPAIRLLNEQGVRLYATHGTAAFLEQSGIHAQAVEWPLDNVSPNAIDFIRDDRPDLVINIPKDDRPDELTNGYMIRRAAVDFNVPLITNRQVAMRFIESFSRTTMDDITTKSWREYTLV